jgi:hypothetical protein
MVTPTTSRSASHKGPGVADADPVGVLHHWGCAQAPVLTAHRVQDFEDFEVSKVRRAENQAANRFLLSEGVLYQPHHVISVRV